MVTLGQSATPATSHKKKFSFSLSKRQILKILKITAIVTALLAILFLSLGVSDYISLNKKSSELSQTARYDMQILKTSSLTKDLMQTVSDLGEVITIYQDTQTEKDASIEYFDKLQKPYEYFFQYILFPSMNIWKNRYDDTIDTTIVGQEYLKQNPYVDNNLISHRTDFFRDIGRNTQYNEINDISIGTLQENLNGSFTLPINVSFSSSNKRSFLMLVDKLSITSNRGNISLINEFLYNLWEELKITNADSLSGATNIDQEIGRGMYKWLYESANSDNAIFVTEAAVDRAVLQTVGCGDTNQSFCYFKFREKFRSIPLLAYTLGFPGNNNAGQLRSFLQYLPPVINVKQFSFEKKSGTLGNPDQYAGKIQIDVFGRAISQTELSEISQALGKQCYVSAIPMTPETAIQYLQDNTKQFGSIARLSNEKSKDLADLAYIFNEVSIQYPALPKYKQVVKLFELYRMLDDSGLCGTAQ